MYEPERVDKLVLLAPAGIVPDKLSFVIRAIPLSLLRRWGIKRINRILFADQLASAEVEEATTLIMTHFKARIGVIPTFTDAELQRLTMPVLLLMGARDALRDAEKIAGRLQKLVPHLTAIVFPKGGHALLNTTAQSLSFLTTAIRA